MQDISANLTGHQPEVTETDTRLNLFTKKNLLFLLLLIVATAAVLFPTLSNGFVNWDDPDSLLENELLKGTLNWQTIKSIFTANVNGNYNPLTILTFAIEKHLFAPSPEASPFIFHCTNLWMHIVCTLLVFVLFLKLGVNSAAAFLGALLFGIHPMRVESVAWVTERKDVLYGMFYLAALICYINYATGTRKRKLWYAAALALSVFSYFSKVQAVSLPLSMVVIDFYLGRRWLYEKILVLEKLPWWLLSILFGIVNVFLIRRGGFFTPVTELTEYSFFDKLAVGAYSYGVYLVKWIYPYKMAHYYEYPAHLPVLAYLLLFAIPAALIAFLIWAVKRNYKYLIFGWAFFTVNVVFLLQVLPVGTAFMADRFTYIAYIGLFFIIAKLYQLVIERSPRSFGLVTGVLAVYCVVLSMMAFEQSKAWKDTFSLCENYIKEFPDSYYGYNQAGVNYLKQSFSPETDTSQKLKLMTDARTNFENAVNADSLKGRPFSTISSDIFQNSGVACGLTGENDLAIYYFSRALELTPANVEAIKNRAYQYFLTRKFVLAIADYNSAIKLVPNDPSFYYLRANCYYSKGDLVNAREDLNKAISMNSRDPNCFIARSVINRAENKITEARNDALIAKNLGADVPAVYFE